MSTKYLGLAGILGAVISGSRVRIDFDRLAEATSSSIGAMYHL